MIANQAVWCCIPDTLQRIDYVMRCFGWKTMEFFQLTEWVSLAACSSYFMIISPQYYIGKGDRLLPARSNLRDHEFHTEVRLCEIRGHQTGECTAAAGVCCLFTCAVICFRARLPLTNISASWRCTRRYFRSSLERDARCFVMRNFVQVLEPSDELLELSPEELQATIGADELNVKSEGVVYRSQWLRGLRHELSSPVQTLGL
jgi:hypothetical protein